MTLSAVVALLALPLCAASRRAPPVVSSHALVPAPSSAIALPTPAIPAAILPVPGGPAPTAEQNAAQIDQASRARFDGQRREAGSAGFGFGDAAPSEQTAPLPTGDPGGGSAPPQDGWTRTPRVFQVNDVLFPGAGQKIRAKAKPLFEAMVKAEQGEDNGLILLATEGDTEATAEGHFPYASLIKVAKVGPGKVKSEVLVDVIGRAKIVGYEKEADGPLRAIVEYPADARDPDEEASLLSQLRDLFKDDKAARRALRGRPAEIVMKTEDPALAAHALSRHLPLKDSVKQEILASASIPGRLRVLLREFIEHKAAEETDLSDVEALREKIKAARLPPHAHKAALRELNVIMESGYESAERPKSEERLDLIVKLPWWRRSQDKLDLAEAERILERSHSGLKEVKERVLEYLAVRKRKGTLKGKVLCFIGPPGTGKTSVAKAVAESLGRRYVRIALGGVHDPGTIRGNRRVWIGAKSGDVLEAMKEAQTLNPVLLFDEIDKLSKGSEGDPRAALLEVLDPKQNHSFRDHFLDLSYDLSEVLFIVTANDLSMIPGPLRDRMEIVEFSGYTTDEKVEIARDHIVAESLKENGFRPDEIAFTETALRTLIEDYTSEAGVRELQNVIGSVIRKIAAAVERRGEAVPSELGPEDVRRLMGPEKVLRPKTAPNNVGVATGLSWSPEGGHTLNVEVVSYPGRGRLILRREMGRDFLDSARNAYGFVRSRAKELGIPEKALKSLDLNVAVAPAISIGGPSAGVVMAAAMASRLTEKAIKPGVAITGEITLTGRVLPIGGLKEKVTAAKRDGYATILFPAQNKAEAAALPARLLKGLTLVPIEDTVQVLKAILQD